MYTSTRPADPGAARHHRAPSRRPLPVSPRRQRWPRSSSRRAPAPEEGDCTGAAAAARPEHNAQTARRPRTRKIARAKACNRNNARRHQSDCASVRDTAVAPLHTSGRRRRGMRPDDDQACGPGGRAPSPATRKPRAPAHPRRRVGRVAGTRTTQGPLVSISRLPGPADADARTEARAEARRHQRIAVAHRGRWPELERRHLSFGPFSTVTDERDGSVYAINRARSTSTPATSPPTTSPSTVIPSSSRSGRADDPQGRHPDRPDRDPRPLPHRHDQARPRAVAHPCAPARTPTRSCSSTTSQTK